MNERGHRGSLVASQPGNANAVKGGVHSPRLIGARAAEIAGELAGSCVFSAAQRLAVEEAARSMAILEAIDRDLDGRGLVDRAGKPRYLLNHRARVSRQLELWLDKIAPALKQQAAAGEEPPPAEPAEYVRALRRIALGRDPAVTTREQLAALKLYLYSRR